MGPDLPHNSGPMRPVSASMPLGTIVNPRQTVGMAARTVASNFAACAVLGAMSKAIPQRAQGETVVGWPIYIGGQLGDGKAFAAAATSSCGMGARNGKDGISCSYFAWNMRNYPVEMLETQIDRLLFEKKQLRADSGGPGLYRGGCGQEVEIRIVGDGPMTCAPVADRIQFPAQGMSGGQPGATGVLLLNGKPIEAKRRIAPQGGDCVTMHTPGGGGFGDPWERDPARVLADVLAGLVSPEQAAASYGVQIDTATKTVDAKATAEIRRSRLLERGRDRGTKGN
ncbi:MAG: hydantoinase B/oxoprolinase family protein [Dehalococcoidia bacterium]|nr:hydantoinase B/oxoprolinase family protein [Dehalococcoidia bacterium]